MFLFLFLLFFVNNLSATIDLGISEIITPVSGCGLTDEEVVRIKITNYGDESVFSATIAYQLDAEAIPMEIDFAGIMPGESIFYDFIVTVDLSEPGWHDLCAWTIWPDDDASNDTICIQLNVLTTPIVDLGADINICDFIVLDAANPGSEFLWNTGENTQTIVVVDSGVYSVVVIDPITGCEDSDTLEINLMGIPNAEFTYTLSGLTISCINFSTNAIAYTWDFSVGESYLVDPVFIFPEPGNYYVSLTAANACSDDVTTSLILVTTVEENLKLENKISIYPVPAHYSIDISDVSNGILNYTIRSFAGNVIENKNFVVGESINIEHLPQGLYFIELIKSNGVSAGLAKFSKI